jgi:phosphatidylglycerol---prolipoprotein diacylglyceryl transferase
MTMSPGLASFIYAIDPVLVETEWVRLWWYGLAYAVGLLTVDIWVWLKRERLGFEGRDVAEFSLLFAAGVLLGGRIFDVTLYEWFYYEAHPWQIPRLWQGGMATHGVLLGAVVGTLLFCRLRGKSFLAVADEIVLPGAVLMALGRVGNHINGEVYGSLTSVAWAMEFPYAEGCRHPVALYDGLKNLLLVPILLGVRSISLRRNGYLPRGLMLGHFVLWYGLLRVFVDFSASTIPTGSASAGASTSIWAWLWWDCVSWSPRASAPRWSRGWCGGTSGCETRRSGARGLRSTRW